jgi:type VI secretion system protein ImpH
MKNIIKSNIKKLSLLQLIRLLRLKESDINILIKKLNIHPNLSLGFNASDFEEIKFEKNKYTVIANFLCTYGTSSVLPTFYTEELLKYKNKENNILRDFYNIFNKRTYQLLSEVLIKYRLMLRISEFKDKEALDFIYSFIGLNYLDNKNIKYINKYNLLKYIDILNHSTKSTNTLKVFLNNLLNITVNIEEYIKIEMPIPKNQLSSLRKNTTIGECYLGRKIKNINTCFKIILKNLTTEKFNMFLPGERNFKIMEEAIEIYFGDSPFYYIVDYQKEEYYSKNKLILNRQISRLGMNMCLGNKNKNYIYNNNFLNLL